MAKVRVPQAEGEIRISFGGGDPAAYPVKGGLVDVPDPDVDRFLLHVDGSAVETSKPSAPAPAPDPSTNPSSPS